VTAPLIRGSIVWVDLDPTRGREQHGTRPALVVSSTGYLSSVRGLVIVLPVTSVDRGWPHHVPIATDGPGLPKRSFAMTEQPRTVALDRLSPRRSGVADYATMAEVDRWLRDFLGH
jgi:mRNA interferase MazF